AEKKPIIGSARVVNPIQVDDSRLYQAAEFEQMVPVAAVTSEPGGVEAQHSANSPAHSHATSRSKPGRATIPLADRPRSSSITSMSWKPRCRATSTSSYCRRWLSRLVWTCAWVDCRI